MSWKTRANGALRRATGYQLSEADPTNGAEVAAIRAETLRLRREVVRLRGEARSQRAETRRQRGETRSQRAETRRQRAEARRLREELRNLRSKRAGPASSRARRPIGLHYDELTRGVNPFASIEHYGVADVDDPAEDVVQLFEEFGVVKIRGFNTPQRAGELREMLVRFTSLDQQDFVSVVAGEREWASGGQPTLKEEGFWPFVLDDRLLKYLEPLLGDRLVEFGSGAAAHYTARGLHRDMRRLVEKPESAYSIADPQRRLVRVLHYCGTSGGTYGFVPFSHNEPKFLEQARRVGVEQSTDWFNRHRDVLREARRTKNFADADDIDRHICYVHADPGDVVLAASAMLHGGVFLTGPRYLLTSTFAQAETEILEVIQDRVDNGSLNRDYLNSQLELGFLGASDVLDLFDARDRS